MNQPSNTIIEAKHTETDEVVACYEVWPDPDAECPFYHLIEYAPGSPGWKRKVSVHVSVLRQLGDIFYKLADQNEKVCEGAKTDV